MEKLIGLNYNNKDIDEYRRYNQIKRNERRNEMEKADVSWWQSSMDGRQRNEQATHTATQTLRLVRVCNTFS
jgi:hypothetical protein